MFITFEGPEGAGKSTTIAAIAERLAQGGHEVVTTREPGSGSLGRQIRRLLLDEEHVDPKSELLLFLADRANHVSETILPALARGAVVLCDRFADSTVVYQGFANGLDMDFIRAANRFATQGLTPDLTILFDLEPSIGLSRLQSKDRLDRQPLEFHRRVRVGFLREAHAEPRRWTILDASRTKEQVIAEALEVVQERLLADAPSSRVSSSEAS
jgi:dTMP kinase